MVKHNNSGALKRKEKKRKTRWNSDYTEFCDNLSFIPQVFNL